MHEACPNPAEQSVRLERFLLLTLSCKENDMSPNGKRVVILVAEGFAVGDGRAAQALEQPGGVVNPDQLRTNPKAVQFAKQFVESGKPVGVICHGPWTLTEAGVVRGRALTSWPSLKTDLANAGAKWVDQEVVTDKGLVSSRKQHVRERRAA
jgi:putative intracellular protease/amidase